jgi:hypothetical protein
MLDRAILAFSEMREFRVFACVKLLEPDMNWFAEPA